MRGGDEGRLRSTSRWGSAGLLIVAATAACLPEETPESHDELSSSEDTVLDAGSDAGPIPDDTYPWLVRVRGCGGALVASNVVVTAAHCVDANYPQYQGGFEDVSFSGLAGVVVEPANLGPIPPGTPDRNNLVHQIAELAGAGPAIAHPWFAGGEEGTDVAVIVYSVDEGVPRHLLTPLRVAMYPVDPVTNVSLLLSPHRHHMVNDECLIDVDQDQETFLRSSSVTHEVDGDSRSFFSFHTESSHACRGDSGSPILSAGKLVSVVSTGYSSVVSGPDLASARRAWLVTNALDRDGDGYEAWEDMCDTHPNWPKGRQHPQSDKDGDGVAAPCDPCDWPSQLNAFEEWRYDDDGDGLVDCVDPCPNDPGDKETGWGDRDGDGLCDGEDSCPDVPTPMPHANSNLEAEAAWSAQILPDACDPVLIPRGAVATDRSTVTVLSSVDTTFYKASTWVEKNDFVRRRHLASRSTTEGESGKETVSGVTTDARFCQPGGLIQNCLAPQVIDEAELHLGLTPELEQQDMPYHRVTLGTAARGAPHVRNFDDGLQTMQWQYEADQQFWADNLIVIVPPAETHPFAPGVSTSGLNGTMWFHARSTAGHPGNDIGTGVHEGEDSTSTANLTNTAQLASHYFAIDPETIRHQEKHFPLELDRPIFAWRDLPRWPDERIFWGVDPFDDLMLFETTSQKVGYLTEDGLIQPLDGVLSSSLQILMMDPSLRWLRSEESWSHRAAKDAPLAVALDGGGTTIAEAAYPSLDGTTLMTAREAGRLPTTTTAPTAVGFQTVYARSLGVAFRIGGTFPTHGASAGVWRFDLGAGTAIELYTGLDLGAVQAVTFDAITREIVVLDRIATGRATYDLRLLRIDAFGRGGRIVKTWSDDGPCSDFHLLVDGAGRLVLAANKPSRSLHTLYTLSGEGAGFSSRRLVEDAGTLASAPWSNELAISVPIAISTLTSRTIAVQHHDVTSAGVASDVATCY